MQLTIIGQYAGNASPVSPNPNGRVFAKLVNKEEPTTPASIPDGPGWVSQLVREVKDITKEWNASFLAQCVDVTATDPRPDIGWKLESGTFTPPGPAQLNPHQRTIIGLSRGVKLTSKSDPSLNGHYHGDGQKLADMRNEAMHIATFGGFSADRKALKTQAMHGPAEFKSPDAFKKVVKAINDWVAKWHMFEHGQLTKPPADHVEID